MFVHSPLLFRTRPRGYTARAVKTSTATATTSVINYSTVDIGIMNDSSVDIYHCGIIAEMVALPSTTGKTDTEKASAIIYTPIKSNMGPPVTLVKRINTTIISPVTRRP